jgi:glycosyltransferase involved in cell wall biosynthesis
MTAKCLYVTADQINAQSGGGKVTAQELQALREFSPASDSVRVMELGFGYRGLSKPFDQDAYFCNFIKETYQKTKLAHGYSGCLSNTVSYLRKQGAKFTYTAAAHDVDDSRREHEALGVGFDYDHLNDPKIWKEYLRGYLEADYVVCPSLHSANVMRSFGCDNVRVIPHGVDLPEKVSPPPAKFTVGYLGAMGPDKGVKYLLQAWAKLDYQDSELVLAGAHSESQWAGHLIKTYGGGKIKRLGWVDDVSTFYKDIALYVQPSVTEGFGIEVIEALAHGRCVICSRGAGAWSHVPSPFTFAPRDADDLAQRIDAYKKLGMWKETTKEWRRLAEPLAWDKVREKYKDFWKEILA